MARPQELPPLDGSLDVLPGFVDFHAAHNADYPWAVFPSSNGGIDSISFSEFAKATHRMAHALRPDRVGADGEVVATIVNCDSVHYVALLVGLVRAGLVVSTLVVLEQRLF